MPSFCQRFLRTRETRDAGLVQLVAGLTALWLVTGCSGGKGASSGEDEDGTQVIASPAVRSASPLGDSEVALSMSQLPVLATFLQNQGGVGAATVGGVAVAEYSADEASALKEGVTGDLDAAAAAQNEAFTGKYWTYVYEHGKAYRSGLEKCRMLQTFGKSLSAFYQLSRGFCSLRFFDQASPPMIKKVSGADVNGGDFFKGHTAAGGADVSRTLEIASDSMDLFQVKKVVVTLKPKGDGGYLTQLALCRANDTIVGEYEILLNEQNRKFDVAYKTSFLGYLGQDSSLLKATAKVSAHWMVSGQKVVMDPNQTRMALVHEALEKEDGSMSLYQGEISVDPSQVTLKAVDQQISGSLSRTSNHLALFKISGFMPKDLKMESGAIKSKYKFTDEQSTLIEHEHVHAMDVDTGAERKFKTQDTLPSRSTVLAADFSQDPLLSKASIAAPNTADLNQSACTKVTSSTYRVTLTAAQAKAVEDQCNLDLRDLAALCDTLAADEGDVLRRLKASPKGIPVF